MHVSLLYFAVCGFVCLLVCIDILSRRQLTLYLSEGCADSANQCCVSSTRSRCTCQPACPGCKCRKIVCLSARIHNICLIMNASVRSITCLSAQRKGLYSHDAPVFNQNRLCCEDRAALGSAGFRLNWREIVSPCPQDWSVY